jgi:putative endonuclease
MFKERPVAPTTKARGDAAEDRALAWLRARGLMLVERNYRVARGPRARGGEIDLILRESDGTLVFVEVRQRSQGRHGGAAASVGGLKQQRLVRAAEHYLLRWPSCHRAALTCWPSMATRSSGCKAPLTPVEFAKKQGVTDGTVCADPCHMMRVHARTAHPATVFRQR